VAEERGEKIACCMGEKVRKTQATNKAKWKYLKFI